MYRFTSIINKIKKGNNLKKVLVLNNLRKDFYIP